MLNKLEHKQYKRPGKVVLILFCFAISSVLANAAADDLLPQLDPLEVRPTLVRPQLSLPTKLTAVHVASPGEFFIPPLVEDIPDDKYGDMVKLGRKIFVNTQKYGSRYVGNGLNCVNCHLQEGRKPNSSPLWAAFGLYPMYRHKTRTVVSFRQRIQDCFRYSMDGIAPTLDSPEVEALEAYSHWLSTGAPVGELLPGRGYPDIRPFKDASPQRGEIIYETQCAMCHGEDGHGQKHVKQPGYMFPPLWGSDSYNKGAGMNRVTVSARFIKANMPLGADYSLSDQDALDVAIYIWIQDRPRDPRMGWIMDFFYPKMNK